MDNGKAKAWLGGWLSSVASVMPVDVESCTLGVDKKHLLLLLGLRGLPQLPVVIDAEINPNAIYQISYLHSQYISSACILFLAARTTKTPHIYTCHNLLQGIHHTVHAFSSWLKVY